MTPLGELVAAELAQPLRGEVRAFAERLAQGARRPPVAVLFYGSALRSGTLDGILDFYVVVDRLADWSHGPLAARANRVLPPNVEYHEDRVGSAEIRAKVAILALDQFGSLCRGRSRDNSVWARFAQPVAAAYTRDPAAAAAITDAVAAAVTTAALWAVRLGPAEATPADFWRALFQRTYRSELRVEKAGRSDSIVEHAPERYERALPMALEAAGLAFAATEGGRLRIDLTENDRHAARRAWSIRRRLAKPLNLARLAKAAFTFKGGADYIAWKIARHSGARIRLTERQRRHPILASGSILWQLWRQRASS